MGALHVEGDAEVKLTLTLPIPPSTNHLYKTIWMHGRARRAKTTEAKAYAEAVGLVILTQSGPVRMRPPIRIDGVLYGPDWTGIDIDNLKLLKDALARAVGVDDRRLVHD